MSKPEGPKRPGKEIDWFFQTADLPATPFKLRPYMTISDPRLYLAMMKNGFSSSDLRHRAAMYEQVVELYLMFGPKDYVETDF